MIRTINEKITIDEYRNNNVGKVAIYDFDENMVIKDGDAEDWCKLQQELEELKTEENKRYTMILTNNDKVINGFWGCKIDKTK